MPNEKQILKQLRSFCRTLPEASEVTTWGHPTFRAGTKTFAVLEEYRGEFSLALKVAPRQAHQLLDDPRFYVTPYVGEHGWLSLRVGARFDWEEVRALLLASYRRVALKRMRAAMDAAPPASRSRQARPARAPAVRTRHAAPGPGKARPRAPR